MNKKAGETKKMVRKLRRDKLQNAFANINKTMKNDISISNRNTLIQNFKVLHDLYKKIDKNAVINILGTQP